MQQRRIPLKPEVNKDIVQFRGYRNDWLWWDKKPQTENTPFELIMIKPDEKTSIHYIEDVVVNVKYILARGEQADQVIEEAKRSLAAYSWEEVLEQYASADNHHQKVQAVYIAGVAAPFSFNATHKQFFDTAMQDKHPEVRIAAIIATGYMGWSEWKTILQDLSANDPNAEVRHSAAIMLQSFDQT